MPDFPYTTKNYKAMRQSVVASPSRPAGPPPTAAERVRFLQEEADAAVGQMVWELNQSLLAIQDQIAALESTRSPRAGVQSMCRELRPQVDRWVGIVGGVSNRQAGG